MRMLSHTRFVLLAVLSTSAALALDVPPVPPTPAAVKDVLFARPFTLETGYEYTSRKEKPTVTTGYLLVLAVEQDYVYPRALAEPVLYVGDQTAQRVNVGYTSGKVIAVVPGDFDLKKAAIWFGTPELPERIDAAAIQAERKKADAAGIKPPAPEKVAAALKAGGERLKVADHAALLREAAALIKKYAPDETERADNLLVPSVEKK